MPLPGPSFKFTRRLGFRLTASYVAFFTLSLIFVGVVFRQLLVDVQDFQERDLVEGDWAALKGYLRVDASGVSWEYDTSDPQDSFVVERLRRVFMLADERGKVLDISPAYTVIGPEPPEVVKKILHSPAPVWQTRHDPWGVPYRIRAGLYQEFGRHRYFVAIGRPLALNNAIVSHFTWQYFSILPFIVAFGGLLGWLLTRQALRPLNEVARTSEAITGANLSLRIPLRGAGDELDRLIDTFNRMIERLENSFQQMRQFTADVSHELRTPVTVVRGQLEVALMTSQSEEQLRDAILTALEETERLSHFVQVMLQLSQAESGQLVLRKEPLNLSLMSREILEQFRIPAEEEGLRLSADLPEECVAHVDRIQFGRLLSNLLSNAIRYTPRGGEVRLELAPRNGLVQIAVQDTGRGIPADSLPHIFERFYRVPSTDSSDDRGLGLGLSFVAWIVKAHDGDIRVSSTPGQGSRFLVTLPTTSGG